MTETKHNEDSIPDPHALDLSRFAVEEDVVSGVALTKKITTIAVRRPSKESWVRTHPDRKGFWLHAYVIEVRESETDTYLIATDIAKTLDEPTMTFMELIPTITRQGDIFLWPIKLPDADGMINPWPASARRIAELGQDTWLRIVSNKKNNTYDSYVTPMTLPEPEWPKMTLSDMVAIAFGTKMITTLDHPLLRRLQGLV